MVQPRNVGYPGAQGFVGLESSILGGDTVSQRGTGGVADCGALEEDDPATCETQPFQGEIFREERASKRAVETCFSVVYLVRLGTGFLGPR